MRFLEKDLEQIIFESDKELLKERGLYLEGKLKRQLKIGNYGICDLLSIEREYKINSVTKKIEPYLIITILELKKDQININTLLQAIRYTKGIKSYIEQRKPYLRYCFNIVLIGHTIDLTSGFSFIPELFDNEYSEYNNGTIRNIRNKTYDYSLEGLTFQDESRYDLTNKGF